MSDQTRWTLQKIREAYLDALDLYNSLFPLWPERKSETEEEPNFFDLDEDSAISAGPAEAKNIDPKSKETTDRPEIPQIWRRDESLEGLSQGLKNRIERAMKFGI